MKTRMYRTIVAATLVFAMIFSNVFFTGSALANTTKSNVLEGLDSSTVVSSSANYNDFGPYTLEDTSYDSHSLTDGDKSTTVPILNGFSAWWNQPSIKTGELYDLGNHYNLSDLVVYADTNTVTGVQIYVGDHTGNLAVPDNLVATLTAADLNQTVSISPRTGRYVLFMLTDVASNGIAKIAELEAYGSVSTESDTIGPDNLALGQLADTVKITSTDGNLDNLQDFSYAIGDSIKTALTDGRVSTTPGSKEWQWDGKLWSGTNGLSYVIGYDLGESKALSRFTMTTPAGQQTDGWRVYVSETADQLFDSAPVCSTTEGMTATSFNTSCSLSAQKIGRYVTFVVKARADQDTFVPSEFEIYGSKSAVLGVAEGITYKQAVAPILLHTTATLTKDGEEPIDFVSGTLIADNGDYMLAATDEEGRVQQLRFTVDIPSQGSVDLLRGKVPTGVVASEKDYKSIVPYTFEGDSNNPYNGFAFTDGNLSATIPIFSHFSRWWHQTDVKSGLLYDLGASYDLSKVSVYADDVSLKGVQVFISQHEGDLAASDNLAVTLTSSQLNSDVNIAPRTGRYLLFLFTDVTSGSEYVAKVAEVQAFGEPNAETVGSGPDNIALGLKPFKIEVTGTDGDLSHLTNLQVSDSVRGSMTDGLVSDAPGSNIWQWDAGKVWSGKLGAKYVVRYELDRHYAVSRFSFSTPAGQSPKNWSVYLSDDNSSIEGPPACTSLSGSELTFNYVCSLPMARTAKYVTFVLESLPKQDALWMNEFQIFGEPIDVWGIAEGLAYNTSVTPMFNNATATLKKDDGVAIPYLSGTAVTADGRYQLVATNSTTQSITTVNFIIDKSAPTISGISEGGVYNSILTPTILDASDIKATLIVDVGLRTAYPVTFTSGTEIKTNGNYRLTVTDAAGNSTSVKFSINIAEDAQNIFEPPYFRGVNLPTAGFASWVLPGIEGQDYDWDKEADYTYFAGKGFDIFRIALVWERLQPTLRGPLDENYLQGLINGIVWAKQHNAKVIIDIHNYGRYDGKIIGEPESGVTNEDFNDLWLKLSAIFKDDPGVYAYDLMNEPHDMGNADWHTTSQDALSAIRNNGDHKLIMVPGNHWESAGQWTTFNPEPWITDPDNNFIYQAHLYFDTDSSGVYAMSYADELAANPNLADIGAERLSVFGEWTKKYKVKGYVGEFGVPNNDPGWLTVLDNFMKKLDYYGMDGTYWAGGGRWGDYPLAIQPSDNYKSDAVQMSVLTNHLTPNVAGILNGAIYGASVTPVLKNGTAMLAKDGETPVNYESGKPITEEGRYILNVTDNKGNITTYKFSIDKLAPTISGVADGMTYSGIVTPTFNDNEPGTRASLTKDGGSPTLFQSGMPITTVGNYVLTVTDAAGNQTLVSFNVHVATQIEAVQPGFNGEYKVQIPNSLGMLPDNSIFSIVLGSVTVQMPVSTIMASGELTNATFSQVPVSSSTRSLIDINKPANAIVLQAFDLNFLLGDSYIHNLSSPATVTVRLSENDLIKLKSGGTPKLYYFDSSAQDFINMGAQFDLAAGTVTFRTTHFSVYVISWNDAPKESGSTGGGNNSTGNNEHGNGSEGQTNPSTTSNSTFNDLEGYDWAKEPITYLASKGIVKGISAGKFAPAKLVTRADFTIMLVKALGLTANYDSSFADVKQTDYYYDAVSTAKKLGIVEGSGGEFFNPKAVISRQDMFVIVARALKLNALDKLTDLSQFSDASEIKTYARQSIGELVAAGLVAGDGKRMYPERNATRAEAAVLIYNIYKYVNEK